MTTEHDGEAGGGDDPTDFVHPFVHQMQRTSLRRAVYGLLLRNGPMSVAQLTKAIERDGPTLYLRQGQQLNKVISDLLRNQMANGRVVRMRRGVYAIGWLSESMRWRALYWRDAERHANERWERDQRALAARYGQRR